MKTVKDAEVCPALAKALKAAPGAQKIFSTMPPSHQREYYQWIGAAKKVATQTARTEKALVMIEKWGKNKK